jgi:hypothetical protein
LFILLNFIFFSWGGWLFGLSWLLDWSRWLLFDCLSLFLLSLFFLFLCCLQSSSLGFFGLLLSLGSSSFFFFEALSLSFSGCFLLETSCLLFLLFLLQSLGLSFSLLCLGISWLFLFGWALLDLLLSFLSLWLFDFGFNLWLGLLLDRLSFLAWCLGLFLKIFTFFLFDFLSNWLLDLLDWLLFYLFNWLGIFNLLNRLGFLNSYWLLHDLLLSWTLVSW